MIFNPLHRMEIRFDGLGVPDGHRLRTVNGARFGRTRNGGLPHQGIDLYARPGTPIFAVADGVIEYARLAAPKYGRDVLLKFELPSSWAASLAGTRDNDADGVVYAEYAHLSGVFVRAGQKVKAGQLLGTTGTSGNAHQRYPHLHFELRKEPWPGGGDIGLGNRINPERLFRIDYSKPVEVLERLRRTA